VLADTSVWLGLAKNINGQKLIVTARVLAHEGRMTLLVPQLVVDEFQRNRERVEADMTRSVSAQLARARDAIEQHGEGDGRQAALKELDNLSHRLPVINEMATRNFEDVRDLLTKGRGLSPTPEDYERAVQRGLQKRAPFHRGKNSAADALLLEMYRAATEALTRDSGDCYCFVTLNVRDFSALGDDQRFPHPDCADVFNDSRSRYFISLSAALGAQFPNEFDELLEEFDFREEPRTYDEIREAEQDLFDRIWYERSLSHEVDVDDVDELLRIAGPGRARVEPSTASKASARTATSIGACSTANSLRCDGWSVPSGISWIPERATRPSSTPRPPRRVFLRSSCRDSRASRKCCGRRGHIAVVPGGERAPAQRLGGVGPLTAPSASAGGYPTLRDQPQYVALTANANCLQGLSAVRRPCLTASRRTATSPLALRFPCGRFAQSTPALKLRSVRGGG